MQIYSLQIESATALLNDLHVFHLHTFHRPIFHFAAVLQPPSFLTAMADVSDPTINEGMLLVSPLGRVL